MTQNYKNTTVLSKMATEAPTVPVTAQEAAEDEAEVDQTSLLQTLENAGHLHFTQGDGGTWKDDAKSLFAALDALPRLAAKGILEVEGGDLMVLKSVDKQIHKIVTDLDSKGQKNEITQDQLTASLKSVSLLYKQVEGILREQFEHAKQNEAAKQESNAADAQEVLLDLVDAPAPTAQAVSKPLQPKPTLNIADQALATAIAKEKADRQVFAKASDIEDAIAMAAEALCPILRYQDQKKRGKACRQGRQNQRPSAKLSGTGGDHARRV